MTKEQVILVALYEAMWYAYEETHLFDLSLESGSIPKFESPQDKTEFTITVEKRNYKVSIEET